MTTIAYKDGIMAGDSRISHGNVTVGTTVKVFKNYRGELLGGCGAFSDLVALRDWFLEGMKGEPPEPQGNTEAMFVKSDGEVMYVWGQRMSALEAPYHAIGSGMHLALGAMAVGANATQAVAVACHLDNGSGGPVHVVALDGVELPKDDEEPAEESYTRA